VSKNIYSLGSRSKSECYNTVISCSPNSIAIAFLRVEGYRESLIYKESPDAEEIIVSENSYVLSPHFAAGFLLRSEKINGEWNLLATNISDSSILGRRGRRPSSKIQNSHPVLGGVPERRGGISFVPFKTAGRPLSISSTAIPGGAIIAWEERTGKKTKIRLSKIFNSEFTKPVDVTDGSFNAYDPVCCVGKDGNIYVAFCAFAYGNYRIKVNVINPDSLSVTNSYEISNQTEACVFPSICTRKNGGIWFSYTCFDTPVQDDETFLKHKRFQSQRKFFASHGSLYTGILFDGKTYAVSENHLVSGSCGAGHSKVIEDKSGKLHILFRHHSDNSSITFDICNKTLARNENAGILEGRFNHPNISIITLNGDQWTKPVCLIARAHVESPISCFYDGKKIRAAFTEDSRMTGWGNSGEWFDDKGQLGVGVFEFPLPDKIQPEYQLRPYVIHSQKSNSIENPKLKSKKLDSFFQAVGQTHAHSNLSVCMREYDRDAHTNYRFMQDVQDSYFGCTTDHAYNMWHTEMLITRKLADYYYFPGQFVSFPAYEWTGSGGCEHEGGPFGHVNPLFLQENEELDFYTPKDKNCKGSSLNKLWKEYKGKNIITPPHHVADKEHWFNWDFFNPEFQPVIELFQDRRGSGENPDAPGVTNYLHKENGQWALGHLKQGKRFGFIGSGDHAGFARAGLLVKELTRKGLFEAFVSRRTFATTGIGLLFLFSCNGFPMGSEVETVNAKFNIKVSAPEPINSIELIRNGEIYKSISVNNSSFSYDHEVARNQKGEFWFCRILFANGELAWSSPIWLD